MKKNLYLLVLLCLSFFACQKKPVDVNVMTFNIRLDVASDSLNNWQYRKDVAARIVKMNDIDILGTQEVLINQLNDLKDRLPDYNVVGVGREDGKEKGEFSALFYKKDKFTEEESGTFWLSENPEKVGAKGWDAACERVATWAVLKVKEGGKRFLVMNTHLDHIGTVARRESVKLLLDKSAQFGKGLPIIITGDFNADPESDVIKGMTDGKVMIDSKAIAASVSGTAYTFHDFGRQPLSERQRIDYIFVNDKIDVLKYQVMPEKLDSVFLSDHTPVAVCLQIK